MADLKKKNKVLIIDDNENDYIILKRYIADEYETYYSDGQENVLAQIERVGPDCIILDYNLGTVKGIDLLKYIKADSSISNYSVIMLTNERNPEVIVNCIKHNATNYLIKDQLNKEDLSLAVNRAVFETQLNFKVQDQQEQILSLTQVDDLTKVFNRRYFIERLDEEISRCHRGGSFFSFALIDLDHFKAANDFYGHLAGDEILKIAARCMKENFRSTDYICRYGGDEFIVVLVEDLYDDKSLVLDHHKEKIEIIKNIIIEKIMRYTESFRSENRIRSEAETPQDITLSIGITSFRDDINDFNTLFHEADRALYFAKESGRNCIACYEESSEGPNLYQCED